MSGEGFYHGEVKESSDFVDETVDWCDGEAEMDECYKGEAEV